MRGDRWRAVAAHVLALSAVAAPGVRAQPASPRVGVAFGGGSARGIAHIGVIQWFEEHHIPIDTAAGTSMGGLIGGAFATGMSAAELRELIDKTDWDVMFGSSSFPFKNVRRKEDARSYPSRLEFGLKGGIAAPTSLNDGQQIDLLLARIAAPYYGIARFDELPTPFRVVAVDLRAGERVVLDSGPLATALRATMSLPGIFPPVERDGRVLVDGGALDNVPADVVRAAGAAAVIAIDVGYAPTDTIDYSMFGLMGRTIDAMMRSSTRAALASADMTIAIDVEGFGSLDWRRAGELIARGYDAAERRRDELLRYRISDADWEAWLAGRQRLRRREVPQPTFLAMTGIESSDAAVVGHALRAHLNVPLNVPALERDLSSLSGLDRYQSIDWQITERAGAPGLLVQARQKAYAPPFLMLGLTIENTTSEDFRVQIQGRYLTFGALGSGSELRVDAGIGADPSVAASLYEPLGGTPMFARALGAVASRTFNFVANDVIIAEYRDRHAWIEGDLGINLSRESELLGGIQYGHVTDDVQAGDPNLPNLSGPETRAHLRWLLDRQDSPVIPSHGVRATITLSQTFDSPEVAGVARTNRDLTQAEFGVSSFYPVSARNRLFVVAAGGTSFNDKPLPTRQFTLGYPFVLDAFDIGEQRGDHYAVVTLGVQRRVGRLPDFIGGGIFAGLWVENGSAFNSDDKVDLHTQIGGGVMLDTLIGPVMLGVSAGVDGGWRTIFGVGRIFR
jgi:NTE family protein